MRNAFIMITIPPVLLHKYQLKDIEMTTVEQFKKINPCVLYVDSYFTAEIDTDIFIVIILYKI